MVTIVAEISMPNVDLDVELILYLDGVVPEIAIKLRLFPARSVFERRSAVEIQATWWNRAVIHFG